MNIRYPIYEGVYRILTFGLVRVYIQEERTYYFPVSEQAGLVWYGCIYNGLNRTGALFNDFLIPKKKIL